jgi:hypothetical protein
MQGELMTTTDMLMEQQEPPRKGSGRPGLPAVPIRREQLQNNPNTWFVWERDARNPSYARKAVRMLASIKESQKFKMNEIPFKAKCFRNDNDERYTVFVMYVPEEN